MNIDAGNFSTRSQAGSIPFFSPRLMRAPYLFIVSAEGRKGLDLFDQFTSMTFSDRTEVTIESPVVRHHDLSDVGRAVTAPVGIRGEAQREVQQQYVAVQEMVVSFLQDRSNRRASRDAPFSDWIAAQAAPGRLTIARTPGTEPVPTAAALMRTLDGTAAETLRRARERDPDAPVFAENALSQLIGHALVKRELRTAAGIAELALELHPQSAVLLSLATRVAEEGGERSRALATATSCSALDSGLDWRAAAAVARCRATLQRLEPLPSPHS